MENALLTFYVIALIIFLGFFGTLLSRKTNIPSLIFLVCLGLILGPILGLFDYGPLMEASPILAALTISVILFESGLNTNFQELSSQGKRGVLLGVLGFVLNVLGIGALFHFVLHFDLLYGIMIGCILGGTCSAVAITVSKQMNLSEEVQLILTIESITTDVLCIVGATTLLKYIKLGSTTVETVLPQFASSFTTGIVTGIALGILWLYLINFLKNEHYLYMFTFATLLLTYSTTELLGGNGGIAALSYGLIFGNSREIFKAFKMNIDPERNRLIEKSIREFHSEITFLISSFFFVFLGLIYVFESPLTVLLGAITSGIVLALRYIAVRISMFKSRHSEESAAVTAIIGKGIAAAALSTLILQNSLPNASQSVNIILNTIIFSNVITVILVVLSNRKKKSKNYVQQFAKKFKN